MATGMYRCERCQRLRNYGDSEPCIGVRECVPPAAPPVGEPAPMPPEADVRARLEQVEAELARWKAAFGHRACAHCGQQLAKLKEQTR